MTVLHTSTKSRGAGPPAARSSFRRMVEGSAWLPLLLLVLLVPWAWAKMLLCCAIILSFGGIQSLSRSATAALLGLLFAMAYLFSPYWRVPCDAKSHALGPVIGNTATMIITAGLLLAIGSAWAWFSSAAFWRREDTQNPLRRPDIIAAAILAALVLAINYAPLYYSVPVHGDEDWHIWRLRNLYMGLMPLFTGPNTAMTLVAAVGAGLFLTLPRRSAIHVRVLILCTGVLIAAIFGGFLSGQGLTYLALRYPFVSCWFAQLGPVWKTSLFDEGAYRLIPLVSVFAIGYFMLRVLRLGGAGVAAALLAAVGTVTIPNLYYHATAMYLELPAVALMTAALFCAERLLKDDPERLRTCHGWYAFLAAGFIKETLAAMVAAIILMRLVVRGWEMHKSGQLKWRAVGREMAVCLCMVAPLGIYVFMRGYFGDVRSYSPRFANLASVSIYITAGKALWSQFGILLPLAAAGAAVAIRDRRVLQVTSLTVVLAADFFFHLMDSPQFVGLARFNLFLFAPLAVMAVWFLTWLAGHGRYALAGVAVVWIAANLAMSPVAPGGERKPYWISNDTITCEFYFPKEEAARWLRDNRPGKPFAVAGAYTDTKIGWYFNKIGYRPQIAVIEAKMSASAMDNLQEAIVAASSNRIPMVLYFRMTPGTELADEEKAVFNYTATQVFTNRWLAIVVYEAGDKP